MYVKQRKQRNNLAHVYCEDVASEAINKVEIHV